MKFAKVTALSALAVATVVSGAPAVVTAGMSRSDNIAKRVPSWLNCFHDDGAAARARCTGRCDNNGHIRWNESLCTEAEARPMEYGCYCEAVSCGPFACGKDEKDKDKDQGENTGNS